MIDFDYRCTECERSTDRKLLTVKKVMFQEMGSNARVLKTRTAAWLCPSCLNKDREWNIPKGDAPGRVNFNNAS